MTFIQTQIEVSIKLLALFLFSRNKERQSHSNSPFQNRNEQRTPKSRRNAESIMMPLKLARPPKRAKVRRGRHISGALARLPGENANHHCLTHCYMNEEENTELICIYKDALWTCMGCSSKE